MIRRRINPFPVCRALFAISLSQGKKASIYTMVKGMLFALFSCSVFYFQKGIYKRRLWEDGFGKMALHRISRG